MSIERLDIIIQKTLPLVYDDSLSYLEFLAKVVAKVNEAVDELNIYLNQDLRSYVEQNLIAWKDDGTLDTLIADAVLDIGSRQYTEQNYVTNSETVTESIDTLDINFMSEMVARAVNVKTLGIKTDGTDQKTALQSIINNYDHLFFPDGEYSIAITDLERVGLTLRSDTSLIFSNNAKIVLLPHELTHYNIINISDVENVHITGGIIDGKRQLNTALSGEYGHGVNIRGCSNVSIKRTNILNCWGDGIYIGGDANFIEGGVRVNSDILIDGVVCDNNRRQGLSLITGKNIIIQNSVFKNTKGTSPAAGIDIEPNYIYETLENIIIKDNVTENNDGGGLLVYTSKLQGSEKPVNISIDNHKSYGEQHFRYISHGVGALPGIIKVNDLYGEYSPRQAVVFFKQLNHPRLQFIRPVIINPVVNGSASSTYDNVFNCYKDRDTYGNTGGVDIIEPFITKNNVSSDPVRMFSFLSDAGAGVYIEDVNIINPLEVIAVTNKMNHNALNSVVKDQYNKLVSDRDVSYSLSGPSYHRLFTNKNFTASRNITLGVYYVGTEITFLIENGSWNMTLIPPIDEIIAPLTSNAGDSLRSNVLGSRLSIKKIDATKWIVTELIGTWTVV